MKPISGSYSSEVEDAWIHNIDRKQLLLAIDRLSGADKHLVYLRYANDMSFKEIAALLGVSEQTAQKRGYRILEKLRGLYEKGFDENVQYV
ncbi:sigma-70 family RNA polymerase sigma factor [Bacteroides sp.]|uniref:RNA polymerase sigma factor n=1 Tax=Bacteroides sp. TaxID=29523 RepID=UPI0026116529|nr:sigma-70 family RNA polymerase sigma factor [Bacteroides sp.]MDD3041201.1 sigma-70 family RNA polymerase sigma factor [Bacteroides sp.]